MGTYPEVPGHGGGEEEEARYHQGTKAQSGQGCRFGARRRQKAPAGAQSNVPVPVPMALAVPVDGVHRGSGRSRQPRTGVVIPDGLDDAGQRGAEHAQHSRRGHRGQPPLTCQGDTPPLCGPDTAPGGDPLCSPVMLCLLPAPCQGCTSPWHGRGAPTCAGTHRGRGHGTRVPPRGSPRARPSWPCSRTPRGCWGRRRCASAGSRAATPP